MKTNNTLQLFNNHKSEKKVSNENMKRKLKFLYRKQLEEVEISLEKINYGSYLDVCIKSIENTYYVQTKDKYLVSFNNSSMFDFRNKIITEFVLKFKQNYKNMILVSENQVTIFK